MRYRLLIGGTTHKDKIDNAFKNFELDNDLKYIVLNKDIDNKTTHITIDGNSYFLYPVNRKVIVEHKDWSNEGSDSSEVYVYSDLNINEDDLHRLSKDGVRSVSRDINPEHGQIPIIYNITELKEKLYNYLM